jgi:histidyl-tRNA synthetase
LEKASKIARYAFILGEDEILKHQVSIKNLEKGTQIIVDRADCVKMIEK